MARRIESLFLEGPAGRLEALLEEPEGPEAENAAPREACLVCHPHPLFGGTMHNKVVYRIARGMRRAGAVVLRFNFRGVNLSEGEHAHGPGEMEDARCALAFLRGRYPELPYSMAGFSFGSRIIMKLGCKIAGEGEDRKPERLIAVGFPTTMGKYEYLAHCGLPKYFVHSSIDVHGPKADLEAAFAGFAEPKQLQFIDAGDHFFAGKLAELEDAIAAIGEKRALE